MVNIVKIYLPTDRRQVLALSIPISDIGRLSVRPVKWLRFVTFSFCGVRGHLSVVQLKWLSPMTVSHLIILPKLTIMFPKVIFVVYAPIGVYHLIDYKATDDRITSEQTIRSSRFRHDIMARDGPLCVFTVQCL